MPALSSTQWITSQGEMWDSISKQVYGTELYMNILEDANPSQIGIVIFDSGVTLNTPVLNTATPVFGTPPWRQTVRLK